MKISSMKGLAVAQLVTIGLIFVMVTLTLSFGAYIMQQTNSSLSGQTNVTVPSLMVGNGTSAAANLGQWLPIIAIVIAAGVIIATLIGAFAFRKNDGV
jgi:CHASE2 domain-containing sensor protein